MKRLLLGDEAIAQGAIDAGLSGVYAYPGTPSTEITEYIQSNAVARERGLHATWCVNEKTAMEAALGMSYAGRRALVCMKHVGMNVCADAFVNAAITGVKGGLVVVAADDPSMHSSQNEQDSRFYGLFALVPILEPSTQAEAYELTQLAFDLSERLALPVLLRIVTRLAHSRASVDVRDAARPENPLSPSDRKGWVLLPGIARRQYASLLQKQADVCDALPPAVCEDFPAEGQKAPTGVIACGIGYNYVREHVREGIPLLKVNRYPLPEAEIRDLASRCRQLLVVEDGQPVVEQAVRALLGADYPVRGRLTGDLPRMGELTSDNVQVPLRTTSTLERSRVGGLQDEGSVPSPVKARPPQLCPGCGHRDVYTALNRVAAEFPGARIFGDIGCYTLGALPPYESIASCVDMGASITMAKGAADAGLRPAIAVIGDSTFTHSGMTGLLDAVNDHAPITVVISDNLTTAMTGGQDSAGTSKYEAICLGLGVEPEHVRVVVPLPKNMDEITRILREEIAYEGVSVVIPRRECIQTAKRKQKTSSPSQHQTPSPLPIKGESGKLTRAEEEASSPTHSTAPMQSFSIKLAGVGGQGILSIATVIGEAATQAGLQLKQAEVHGMSQRGGDVQSDLRLSTADIHSDLIPLHGADLILSMEPMEALRYTDYLHPQSWVVTSARPFENIPDYPSSEAINEALSRLPNVHSLDIEELAKAHQLPKSANMVLLGMAARHIPILSPAQLRGAIARVFARKGDKVVNDNINAFDLGYETVQ